MKNALSLVLSTPTLVEDILCITHSPHKRCHTQQNVPLVPALIPFLDLQTVAASVAPVPDKKALETWPKGKSVLSTEYV